MAYLQPDIKPGYNAYLDMNGSPEVGMDVGLLVLEPGQRWESGRPGVEVATLLLEGEVIFQWEGRDTKASRRNPFQDEAFCLHTGPGVPLSVQAVSHAELYIQAVKNANPFPSKLYAPEDVMVQHAGDKNELLGAMRREIKTFFDYESAPWSQMVLGEVLNFPGKWSSYPPHHHPQPEVYFHRFDRPLGFGASFGNGEVYTSRQNGLTVILDGFHSQTAAPGYAMCYMWGIRHLPGNPWQKTRIDDPGHEWLWKADANEYIFRLEGET
ncbi:MAG: 5-deoxy-glucuronate isomerase [Eubacteriales bacterium]|nr:5-deoxy-glucuronate isomerase [Eubacteriales bacterium]